MLPAVDVGASLPLDSAMAGSDTVLQERREADERQIREM